VTSRIASGLLGVAAAACGPAPPSGFSGGADDRWTFPLVGALEDGLLLTPVFVGSTGPYLFAIDPDAPTSVVDGDVVKQAKLRTFAGPARLDEAGAQQQRVYAEIVALELGSLIVDRRTAIVVRPGTFDSVGRRIHGVIGRDIIADSLVFGFDRDHALGYLTLGKEFAPPPGALALPYHELPGPAGVLPRRVISGELGGQTLPLHVDLGAATSQLREPLWTRVGLVGRDIETALADEAGTVRRVGRVSEPLAVTVGAVSVERVVFVPYDDRRWDAIAVAGTLGLGFFVGHDVWLQPEAKTLHLVQREPIPLATRLARWDTGAIHKCTTPGCLDLRLIDPLAGKPPPERRPHPGVILSITREELAGGMGLEVVLEARGRPELPQLIVNLPPHVDRLLDQLDPKFLGTTLDVLDASPYPRDCPSKQGCVDKLARP
jgi:hypothetical protein